MPKIEFYKPKKDTREKLTILEISWKLNLNFLLEYLRIHDPPPDLFRIRVRSGLSVYALVIRHSCVTDR